MIVSHTRPGHCTGSLGYRVYVELRAFQDDGMRPVVVPIHEWDKATTLSAKLEVVFKYGQNDFQPLPSFRSVSVGDIIRLPLYEEGFLRFRVMGTGFAEAE